MPRALEEYSWRTIRGFGPVAASMFNVGDTKSAVLKDGTPVEFRIIGRNHDRTKDGLILPLTWEMVDCMPQRYPWNDADTNEGSWAATKLRRMMNEPGESIFELMPDEIIDVAVPVLKLTANTFDGSNELIETEDRFFIKSEKELFGRCIYSAPGEGHWYEYYRQEDVPYYKMRSGSREYLLLRSPFYAYSNSFCFVTTGGDASSYTASCSGGLAPAFAF